MVLAGSQAAVRILTSNPAFYVQSTGGAGTKMVLLKLKAGNDHRVVESVEARREGELSESRTALPVVITRISPTLFEIKPDQPLNSGEYALGEVGHNQLNLAVWDFGIGSLNIQPRKPRTRSRILPLLSPRIP